MAEEPLIKTSLPFSGCARCSYFSIETVTDAVCADGRVLDGTRFITIYCRHEDVCRNAVDIWKMDHQDSKKLQQL